MRSDMAKVLVERSRRGGHNNRKGRSVPLDDLPSKESMKRQHTDRKELNENLAPLKRFLQKSVGRKWNDVYSEICANLKLTSAVQRHILEHLEWYVHVKPYPSGNYRDFYVDDSGTLRAEPKKRWRPRKEVYPNLLGREAIRIGGVWYAIKTKTAEWFCLKRTYGEPISLAFDEIMRAAGIRSYWGSGGYATGDLEKFWGKKGVSGYKGKQLSKKEIRDARRRYDNPSARRQDSHAASHHRDS